jgi:hypothetical protein
MDYKDKFTAILLTNDNPFRTVWEKLSKLAESDKSQIVSFRLWQNLNLDGDARKAQ